MAAYVEGPRHYRITDDDHGAKVLVAAYIMMVNTVLSVVARAGIKLTAARKWDWDDTTIIVAMLVAIGHTGTMAASYKYGMGRRVGTKTVEKLDDLKQCFYAGNVLYLASVVFSKISIILFIHRITPSRNTKRVCWVFFAFIILWGSSALLVRLFACGLPTPWRSSISGHCINLAAFTKTTGAIDLATDALLVMLPIWLFATLRYQGPGRWTIIAVFSMRIFILIPGILRLLSVHDAFERGLGSNFTWYSVPFQVWTSVLVHFSVISASIPSVRPFLRSLESGLYDASMRAHPRLQRLSEDHAKNFQLMTLSGWSVRMGLDRKSSVASSNLTGKQPLRQSKRLTRRQLDSPDLERQQSLTSEAEFARRLHPQHAEYRTSIQGTRKHPQFGRSSAPYAGKGKAAGSKSSWQDISVTQETSIRFEERGKVTQEVAHRLSNV